MDCCNYMQYRHHQPYYGSQYYHEPLPPYHGDFYGQPVYHDYYTNGPYYAPQHWHAAGGFMQSDYVYNPKEARMRKAMREATRDRSIGASPMLPRPSARRAASIHPAWPPTLDEPPHLMMSSLGPLPGMHRPHCYTPQPGGDQFLPVSSYAKLSRQQQASPQLPPAPPPSAPPTASYLQPSPLAQLQHQTEMWHNFQDDMRPTGSTGNPYMMPDVQQPYHHHQPSPPLSIPSPLMMDKHRQTPLALHPLMTPPLSAAAPSMPMTPPHSINSNLSMTPPHSNENVPPDESFLPQRTTAPQGKPGVEQPLDEMQPLGENNYQQLPQQQQGEEYLPVYSVPNSQPQFENRMEDVKTKRMHDSPHLCQRNPTCKNSFYLPLSCTNFCASPDLIANNVDYQRDYIQKYFQNFPEYDVLNFTTDKGDMFPYASLPTSPEYRSILEDTPQPNFIQTDVGYIPIIFNNCKNILDLSQRRCNASASTKTN